MICLRFSGLHFANELSSISRQFHIALFDPLYLRGKHSRAQDNYRIMLVQALTTPTTRSLYNYDWTSIFPEPITTTSSAEHIRLASAARCSEGEGKAGRRRNRAIIISTFLCVQQRCFLK